MEQPPGFVAQGELRMRAPGSGLLYKNYKHTEIQGYTDADWAGSFDKRSTSGYCVFVGGNLVSWKSKKFEDQLADLFTKCLGGNQVLILCNKLGSYDMSAPI
ncbi:hypothetical protein LIER_37447 [Lithospermum erythrorhizon]|uniref:Mitochondrial protein n=1 Tax=Lithospermum erythrorhizon TaxID=34254 RepID=A0AAV3PM74_LITER